VEATRARGAVSLIVGTLFFGVLENLRRACDLCINHIADAETKAEGVFALTGWSPRSYSLPQTRTSGSCHNECRA